MSHRPDGHAIIYCEGAFGTTNGKTAHGLVRKTSRYNILSVIDSRHQGQDAGVLLDGHPREIPVYGSLKEAVRAARPWERDDLFLVMGLAPDGGRLGDEVRRDIMEAIKLGLHVDSGLHDFLSEDVELVSLASRYEIRIRDIRKPPPRHALHFFSGRIEEVPAFKVAVLGTDSAVGKRTTAWMLVDELRAAGYRTEMVGTGQTSWMQGAEFSIVLDSLVNDFVAGEIEHIVWKAWKETGAEILIIEGQGSLMNPAYPGGFEIMAAARPDAVIMQHAPARKEYDGFPGYPIHPLEKQIEALELLYGKPIAAVAVNREDLDDRELAAACREIKDRTGLLACDVLGQGVDAIASRVVKLLPGAKNLCGRT
jgi:uncharacterized NAD-dependent epimerase/dehydratase family protein